MAGSEKSGYNNSKAMLLENAYYILTPSDTVPSEKVLEYTEFVTALKALPVTLGYKEHDFITGTISHLPHIIAASLVNFVKDSDTEEEWMKHLAAGGFKDITRIASSSPTMWQHICSQNRENISQILTDYIQLLTQAKEQIAAGDEQAVTDYSILPEITAILFRIPLPVQSKGLLLYIVTSLTKPEESQRLRPFLLPII